MKTKKFLTLVLIALLPLNAMAENISGAMYVAPANATQNNPAPTTNAAGPYGRINIDTDDQQHVASTAYVKGAYNSAIAAINTVEQGKQVRLFVDETYDSVEQAVLGKEEFAYRIANDDFTYSEAKLVTGQAVASAISAVDEKLDSKRVEVYTTWDNDNAKKQVAFVTASQQ